MVPAARIEKQMELSRPEGWAGGEGDGGCERGVS